jgi:hypothetical protein
MIRRFLSRLFDCPTSKEEYFLYLEKYYAPKIPKDQLKDIGDSYWQYIGDEEENMLEYEKCIKQFYSKYSNSNTSNSSKYYAEYAVESGRFDILRWLIDNNHISSQTTCLFQGSLLYLAIDGDIDAATQTGEELNLETTKFLIDNGINKLTKKELGIGNDVLYSETSLNDIRTAIKIEVGTMLFRFLINAW